MVPSTIRAISSGMALRPPSSASVTGISVASNVATAEMLILGLARGDLDWRDIVNPKTKPFTA